MKWLVLIVALTACSTAPRVHTTPEIGISFNEFSVLCNVQGELLTANTVTNSQGSTLTIKLTDTPEVYSGNRSRRALECVGTFTFVNGELTTITR